MSLLNRLLFPTPIQGSGWEREAGHKKRVLMLSAKEVTLFRIGKVEKFKPNSTLKKYNKDVHVKQVCADWLLYESTKLPIGSAIY